MACCHIGIVAYNLPTHTDKLLASLKSQKGHEVYIHLFLHASPAVPRYEEVLAVCEKWGRESHVLYYPHKRNRGLSRSWSDTAVFGYENGADTVFIINDDIEFDCARDVDPVPGYSDLDRFLEFSLNNPHKYLITVEGFHQFYADGIENWKINNPTGGDGWRQALGINGPRMGFGGSCFAFQKLGYQEYGVWDRNYFKIYFEDCDMFRRGYLGGDQMDEVKGTRILHWGSLSWRVDEELHIQNAKTQPLNGQYYIRKWGGPPGQERFTTPFNDPSLTLRIAPEDREHPYGPDYDRYDEHLVVPR